MTGSISLSRWLVLLVLIAFHPAAVAGIDEQVYQQVIEEVAHLYRPEFTRAGQRLQIRNEWQNETVQASAWKQEDADGEIALILISGGIARHRAITADAFALILCHEIGHHLGGPPRVWKYSVEGQADAFAALHCLPRLFEGDPNSEIIATQNPPAILTQACERAFEAPNRQAICVRIALAGQALSRFFAAKRELPSPRFDTPDITRVEQTKVQVPSPQCRLDTYFAGALCHVAQEASSDLSKAGFKAHACHLSGAGKVEVRPRCWFKGAAEASSPPSAPTLSVE